MISIEATGSGVNKRMMAIDLAYHSLSILMPRVTKLTVDIRLINRLREKESLAGDCSWEDSSYRPKHFTIRADSSQTLQEMLETVAHEMVHVKQYYRGELKDYSGNITRCKWKGEVVECDKINYYDHPWEIEAHGRERGLFIRWFEQSRWKKCKWANY